ncbi:sigma 54-interacting transcriptional regulator [Sporolactobacillus sp. Y61]|uniref:Sigma 54-interacting transcriptional regulator n=1 Tax=Sporolactobacillus sp. Y61 TaxID=3160863 RepID=A0AAU8IFW7_9BACL
MDYFFLEKLQSIGVFTFNHQRKVCFYNQLAQDYQSQFNQIMDLTFSGATFYSICSKPAEVQIITDQNDYFAFIKPVDKLVRLISEKEELQTIQTEFNQLIDSSFDGIVFSDNEGIILYQNPAYEKIAGLSTKFCVGKSLKTLQDEGIINVSASLRALAENRPVTVNQKINTGASVLVTATPIHDKNGSISKVVNNVRDLTYLQSLEKEVKDLEAEKKVVYQELEVLKSQTDTELSIVAHSEKMQFVIERALRVAQIDSIVLIQGESGVGKEKIVDLIHKKSRRSNGSLIKVNCGAIPETLLESELFGYESGSFTGAHHKGKPGLFEAANKGTIFLDEIGEMSLPLQVKLLRVLQEFEIVRVGGSKPISIDVRVIAATNKDLNKMSEEGMFRKDLYYRLNIIPIVIPPLRERKEDIVPLIYHFLKSINYKYGFQRSFSKDALDRLQKYKWPGNVRELRNLVERMVLMNHKSQIDVLDIHNEMTLNQDRKFSSKTSSDSMLADPKPLKKTMAELESHIIQDTINKAPSVRAAASILQIDPSTLVRKMQKYHIKKGKKTDKSSIHSF